MSLKHDVEYFIRPKSKVRNTTVLTPVVILNKVKDRFYEAGGTETKAIQEAVLADVFNRIDERYIKAVIPITISEPTHSMLGHYMCFSVLIDRETKV